MILDKKKFNFSLDEIGFAIFQIQVVIAFVLPEVAQKPFKILLGLFYILLFGLLLYQKEIKLTKLIPALAVVFVSFIVIAHGAYQSSLVNAVFCTFGLLIVQKLKFKMNEQQLKISNIIYWMAFASIILQLLFFRSYDGRPKLSYEINLSAAFLFLFFLYSDYLGKRVGQILVILISLVLLSRLLILAMLLFFIIRGIQFLYRGDFKLNFPVISAITIACFLSFNAWFLLNIEKGDSYNSSASRVTELNDGSNMLRFIANLAIVYGLTEEKDQYLRWGYGDINSPDNAFSKSYLIMPHNEILTSIAEYGYILTAIFVILTYSVISQYFRLSNFDYFIPLFVYTLILWVRFMAIPSFEMVFIIFLYMLRQNSEEDSGNISSSYS